jgi:hypothetical protein
MFVLVNKGKKWGIVHSKHASYCHTKIHCIAGHQWLMPLILATWGAEVRRIVVWGQPSQAHSSQDPISKITRAKWTGGMAQVVQFLLFKPWVQASVPPKNFITFKVIFTHVIMNIFVCFQFREETTGNHGNSFREKYYFFENLISSAYELCGSELL